MAQAKKKAFKAKDAYSGPKKIEKKASEIKGGDLEAETTQAAEISQAKCVNTAAEVKISQVAKILQTAKAAGVLQTAEVLQAAEDDTINTRAEYFILISAMALLTAFLIVSKICRSKN